MKLPKKYGDLTVQQYQQVKVILDSEDDVIERHVKLIACLSGKTCEFVEKHTPKQIAEWAAKLDFLNTPEFKSTFAKRVFINHTWYMPIIGNEEFTAGALVTLKHLEKQDPTKSLNQALACIYVPMNWMGKPKPYNAGLHNKIAEDMLHAKLDDVVPFLEFKKKVLEASSPIMNTYLEEAMMMIAETMSWLEKETQMELKHS